MKLEFKKNLIGVEGKEIPNSLISETLAGALAYSNKGDAIKFWDWARKLHLDGSLDIDRSDIKKLEDFILQHEGFANILKAQALDCLNVKE